MHYKIPLHVIARTSISITIALAGFTSLSSGTAAAVSATPVANHVYSIKGGGYNWEIPGSSKTAGQQAGTEVWNAGLNQRFQFRHAGNGYFNIIPLHTYNLEQSLSGMCLDVAGASDANWTGIIQHPCNGGDNQAFKIVSNGSGYAFQAKHGTNKYIGVDANWNLGLSPTPHTWGLTDFHTSTFKTPRRALEGPTILNTEYFCLPGHHFEAKSGFNSYPSPGYQYNVVFQNIGDGTWPVSTLTGDLNTVTTVAGTYGLHARVKYFHNDDNAYDTDYAQLSLTCELNP